MAVGGIDIGFTTKTKDRLKGIYLQVCKPGWDGDVVERVVEDGSVPGESSWDDYSNFHDLEKKSGLETRLDRSKIKTYTQDAEGGGLTAAYWLYRHYSHSRDVVRRNLWANKFREMASKKPNDKIAVKILATVNQAEAANDTEPLIEALDKDHVKSYTCLAEHGAVSNSL